MKQHSSGSAPGHNAAAAVDRSRAPEPASIRTFEFPAVERRRQGNGLTFLTARGGDLPLVTVRAVVDAGAAAERTGEEGLAWLTAESLEGGTSRRTGEELAWAVERLGAELHTQTGWDGVHVALTTAAHNLGAAVGLLAEIVREPAFPEREVERIRAEQLAEMMRRRTEPRALADDAAARFIFADGATYGRTVLGFQDRVQDFTAEAVREFHRSRYVPGRTAIVVVGAVDADAAEAEVSRAFGDWTGTTQPAPPPVTTPRHDRTTIHVVDRPSAVQSEVRIGHVGVPRDTADYFPLLVMNAVLGGAFTSRLNLNLREKHGFTYGVRSGFAFRRASGPFVIQTAVASDVTARAVEETLKELRGLVDSGLTDEETASARDYLAGTMPLEMQTTEQLAARVAELHVFDLPTDHFDSARERIRAVTADEAHRVANLRLQLDRLSITVAGSADAIAEDLRALGIGDVVIHGADENIHLSEPAADPTTPAS
ncbi:MAG TPA: pitrilysin family protein [Longimicrobiales bacterium]|nr:pitrilysin family protein [Longimicrobiales bacterium]